MAHFEIKNLNFSYPAVTGKKALEDINLNIERGEYVAVCGKSGSGNTLKACLRRTEKLPERFCSRENL